ncbi:hypothetical protein MMC13_005922 [Lambiella insularis]|nr:hypothetical protein [Lambiella insularis]
MAAAQNHEATGRPVSANPHHDPTITITDGTIIDTSSLRTVQVVIMPPKGQLEKQPSHRSEREPASESLAALSLSPKDSSEVTGESHEGPVLSAPELHTSGESSAQTAQVHEVRPVSANLSTSVAPGSQPVGLKFQPKNAVRRSKEDREAQEKAEEEKRLARLAANRPAPLVPRGGRGRGAGWYARGGFRGGLNGWRSKVSGIGRATGPLSGPIHDQLGTRRRRRGHGRATVSGSLHGDGSTSSNTTRVKREPTANGEKGKGNATGGTRKASRKSDDTQVKVEDSTALYISSDDDVDEFEGPRINIEHINLISDDDSEEAPTTTKGKEKERLPRQPALNLQPVRLDRHEHVERHVGVNTDVGSTHTWQDVNQKAEADLIHSLSQAAGGDKGKTQAKKVRSKGKDVEFVRNERRWKGVYQDDQDDHDTTKVKKEPEDEDAMILEVPSVNVPTEETVAVSQEEIPPQPAAIDHPIRAEEDAQLAPPKVKRRQRTLLRPMKPTLQTVEDRQEWERYEEDVLALNEELVDSDEDFLSGVGTVDADGDIIMDEERKDRREGLVYLFQLPPVLPRLIDAEKVPTSEEEEGSDAEETSLEETFKSSLRIKAEPGNELEEDGDSDAKDPNAFWADDSDDELVGHVGTMTIFESGYVGFDWGGIQHDVSKAAGGSMLQEVVVTDVSRIKREPGSEADDDGGVVKTATAMGQLAGGFIVTPNWETLLE